MRQHGRAPYIWLGIAIAIIVLLSIRVSQYDSALEEAQATLDQANAEILKANSGAENFSAEISKYMTVLGQLRQFQAEYNEQSYILLKQLTVLNTLTAQSNRGVQISEFDLASAQEAYVDQANIFLPKSKAYDRFLLRNSEELDLLGLDVAAERKLLAETEEAIQHNLESFADQAQ